MDVYTYKGGEQLLQTFKEFYTAPRVIIATESPKNELKPEEERICRYCDKSFPEVSFNKDAHIIPHLLGKNNLLCDYECDVCNSIFSKYESALVNWLGITRTIIGTKTRRNKIPGFVSQKGEINAHVDSIFNVSGTRITSSELENGLNVDIKNGKASISYLKKAYIPLDVYFILLKIAFAFLPEDEVDDYRPVIQMLTGKNRHLYPERSAIIKGYRLEFDDQAIYPYGILFKKRNELDKLFSHFFVFYYANMVYTYPLPYSIKDIQNKCYNGISLHFPPPILFDPPPPDSYVIEKFENLGSSERVKDDIETISFDFNPKEMENMVAFNPKTGAIKDKFDPTKIVGMFLVENGSKIKFPPQT